MAVVTSKLLQKSENFSLELLYLLGALGEGRHKLILLKRFQGRIVDVSDYDLDVVSAMVDEIRRVEPAGKLHDTSTAPESKLRCEWMQSSGGHIVIRLLADRVELKRNPLGQYEIDYGHTDQQDYNHVQWNAATATDSPRSDTGLLSATGSSHNAAAAIALFY